MQLQTVVETDKTATPINYSDKLMLMGSCFAENIGNLLIDNKFQVDLNPFGITYNPLSVKSALTDLIENKLFGENDLFVHQNLYHSFSHHSEFSSANKEECLMAINKRVAASAQWLKECDYLLITFGTAYVYYLKSSDKVVSNCHKLPEKNFSRIKISVVQIVTEWRELLKKIQQLNPHLKIIFTVSPIRHWKDGAHENQLSKATLMLAIDELSKEFDHCSYFPAYEIVMDELRDYRFYTEDMIHPTNQTINYIWERFCDSYLSSSALQLMAEWEKIKKSLSHRPFNPDTEAHKTFLAQIMKKMEQLTEKSPYFALSTEIAQVREKLQHFD